MFRFSMKLKPIPQPTQPTHPQNNHHLKNRLPLGSPDLAPAVPLVVIQPEITDEEPPTPRPVSPPLNVGEILANIAPDTMETLVEQVQDTLIVKHTAGFFSCCSVKLHMIVKFINSYKVFPQRVNGVDLFTLYKLPEQENQDITHVFFEHPSEIPTPISKINYIHEHQYIAYSQLDYKNLMPVMKTFFEPSAQIVEIVRQFENKYGIDAENCIAVYYRGTDKISETQLDSFDRYYDKLTEVLNTNHDDTNCKILLQSDSAQFFYYMKCKFRDSRHSANLVIIDEIAPTTSTTLGAHYERTGQRNHSDIKHLLAAVVLISKCKHVICSSGNVSTWMMLYRGNSANVHQNLNLAWLE